MTTMQAPPQVSSRPGTDQRGQRPRRIAFWVLALVLTCTMLGTADLRAALPGMTMPAAIVVGEEDYATPVAMAEAMNRGIKDSTLTVLKGARHLTPLEAPDAIAEELIVLLKRAKDRVEKP